MGAYSSQRLTLQFLIISTRWHVGSRAATIMHYPSIHKDRLMIMFPQPAVTVVTLLADTDFLFLQKVFLLKYNRIRVHATQ